MTPLGPFDRWPVGKGFQHFFGFLGGATDQYKPDLVEDTEPATPDGRHLNIQLVDKAIGYIGRQESLNPDKPFFMYLAPGATHAPHQVDLNWIQKYKGKFDDGWDVYRERVLARQKAMGLIPADARLPVRDPRIPAWSTLSEEQKTVYERFMEAYAGYLEETDAELGRLVDYLDAKGLLENTAIFVIIGDNGASREGSLNGTIEGDLQVPKVDSKGQIAALYKNIDKIGTGQVLSNYPAGWALAADTPFRLWKGDANAEGAIHNPLIVYWRGHVPHGMRTQYSHITDMTPTLLDLGGVAAPSVFHGVPQDPIQGVSLTYAFDDDKAPTRHGEQYYFLFGKGAIVSGGWKASFDSRPDGLDISMTFPPPKKVENNAGKEVWALYDLNTDFNERHDLAQKDPAKLAEMKALFAKEAEENHVYPLINMSDVWNRVWDMGSNFWNGGIKNPAK